MKKGKELKRVHLLQTRQMKRERACGVPFVFCDWVIDVVCFLSYVVCLTGAAAKPPVPASAAAAAAAAEPQDGAGGGDGDNFVVGDRVWVNGNKPGVVQFLGETQFAPGQWAGIVLDEPIGKNDGSVAGVRYFQCDALRGIFTRPSKLSRTEGEANGTLTAPASRASSPTPSQTGIPCTPAAKKTPPSAAGAAAGVSTPSNLTRANSESVSNLSETGSVKKGERELKHGDRVLVRDTC